MYSLQAYKQYIYDFFVFDIDNISCVIVYYCRQKHGTLIMTKQIETLLAALDHPDHIDLDAMRSQLCEIAELAAQLTVRCALYEAEIRNELRAKVELCGGIPSCRDGEAAVALSGAALLGARREASRHFNQAFHMAPLSRRT
jgi:hypothetical protein